MKMRINSSQELEVLSVEQSEKEVAEVLENIKERDRFRGYIIDKSFCDRFVECKTCFSASFTRKTQNDNSVITEGGVERTLIGVTVAIDGQKRVEALLSENRDVLDLVFHLTPFQGDFERFWSIQTPAYQMERLVADRILRPLDKKALFRDEMPEDVLVDMVVTSETVEVLQELASDENIGTFAQRMICLAECYLHLNDTARARSLAMQVKEMCDLDDRSKYRALDVLCKLKRREGYSISLYSMEEDLRRCKNLFWVNYKNRVGERDIYMACTHIYPKITVKAVAFVDIPDPIPCHLLPSNQFFVSVLSAPSGGTAWHPDENQPLLAVATKTEVYLFNTNDGTYRIEQFLDQKIQRVEWLAEGTLIVCSEGLKMTLVTSNERIVLAVPIECVIQLAPHPKNAKMFAGMNEEELCIWFYAASIRHDACPTVLLRCPVASNSKADIGCEWSATGDYLALYDRTRLRVWSLKSCNLVFSSIDGYYAIGGCTWDFESERTLLRFACKVRMTMHHYVVFYRNGCVSVFDREKAQFVKSVLLSTNGRVQDVVVRGKRMAVVYESGNVVIDCDFGVQDEGICEKDIIFADTDVEEEVKHLAGRIDSTKLNADQGIEKESGTMGKVLFGKYMSRDVAVKRVSKSEVVNQNELLRLAKCERHKNLIRYLGFYSDDKRLHFVLEWMRGGSDLGTFLRKNVGITECLRVHVALQISDALNWLHSHGWAHGDLKVDNVVGDVHFWKVKLIDLGICRPIEGHPEMDKFHGRYFPTVTTEVDWQCFAQHIIVPIWKKSDYCIQVVNPMTLADAAKLKPEDYKQTTHWLQEKGVEWLKKYRFYILRNARFKALCNGKDIVELKQRNGKIFWDEETLKKYKVSLDQYVEEKVDKGMTICTLRPRSCCSGPIFQYQSNEHDMENVKKYTPRFVVDDKDFDFLQDHPIITPSFWADWFWTEEIPCDSNKKPLPWCLNVDYEQGFIPFF